MVKVKKLHPDARIPEYKTEKSAGFDFYSIDTFIVEPGETKVIPSGLAFEIGDNSELNLRGRSGLSLKHCYMVKEGTIDEDYRGEVGFIISNYSLERLVLEKGDRIAQGVISPVIRETFIEVKELTPTERGAGGFGHTGR